MTTYRLGCAVLLAILAASIGLFTTPSSSNVNLGSSRFGPYTGQLPIERVPSGHSNCIPSDSLNSTDPILIYSDGDFGNQGWPGNGTAGDPFVIANLRIESNNNCLRVENTKAHFVIRNCELIGYGNSLLESSVYFQGIENGAIQNCTIDSESYGIHMNDTNACSITSSSIHSCSLIGIHVTNSTHCIFSSNDLTGIGRTFPVYDADSIMHAGQAIEIENSANCTIYSNQMADNADATAILLIRTDDCHIYSNHISRNYIGIDILSSNSTRICDNLIFNCTYSGLDLYYSMSCTILNNTFENCGLVITGLLSHYIHDIYGNNVNGKPLGYFFSTSYRTINGARYGQVFFVNTTSMTLDGGDFRCTSTPVNVIYSANCTVTNVRTCETTGSSVLIRGSADCHVLFSVLNSSNFGLKIEISLECTIMANKIENNTYHGLDLSHSNRCLIIRNSFRGNGAWGVYSSGSNQNRFYGNVFMSNSKGNARDWNSQNIWDDGVSRGNVWDDYIGIGPYHISGTIFTFDCHPRSLDRRAEFRVLMICLTGFGILGIAYFVNRSRIKKASPEGVQAD